MKFISNLFILDILPSSCSQYMTYFSCYLILNNYVSTNQNKLKSISTTDLASSSLAFQRVVFRSSDAEKKQEVRLQKIQTRIRIQNYSEDEYTHAKSSLNHLLENCFAKEHIDAEAIDVPRIAAKYYPNTRVYIDLDNSYKERGLTGLSEQAYYNAWHMNPSRFTQNIFGPNCTMRPDKKRKPLQ